MAFLLPAAPAIAAATSTGLATGASLAPLVAAPATLAGATFAAPGAAMMPAALSSAMGAISSALPVISTGLNLVSGIGGRLQAANTAQAQADMYEHEAKLAEQRQIQRDQALISKEHANAAASGLTASSGSPLATTMASTDDLRTNTAAAGYSERRQAASRRMEGNSSLLQIPGILADALNSKASQSILGYLIDRRRYY